MSTEIVPLQSNLLLVSSERNALSPPYRFSHLPYTDKEHDISSNAPFLSEAIACMPSDSPANQLEAGVHLHWIIASLLIPVF